jgi:penicillin-binding protein 1A
VQLEYIRDGQETVVGGYGRTVDGGWRMGADVPLVSDGAAPSVQEVTIGGETRQLPSRPSMGTISGGGLY